MSTALDKRPTLPAHSSAPSSLNLVSLTVRCLNDPEREWGCG